MSLSTKRTAHWRRWRWLGAPPAPHEIETAVRLRVGPAAGSLWCCACPEGHGSAWVGGSSSLSESTRLSSRADNLAPVYRPPILDTLKVCGQFPRMLKLRDRYRRVVARFSFWAGGPL